MSYNRNKQPCRFFQQGHCKFGNSCKYAHVYSNNSNNGYSGKYGSKDNSSGSTELSYQDFIQPGKLSSLQRNLELDLGEVPSFQMKPLSSAFGLADPCALNLINGRDYSMEEFRWQYMQAQKNNTLPQYEIEVNARDQDMRKCILQIKQHPDFAVRYSQKCTQDLKETGTRSITKDFIQFPLNLSDSQALHGNTNTMMGNNSAASAFGTGGFGQAPTANPFAPVAGPTSGGAFGAPSFGSSGGGAFGAPKFGATRMGAATNTNSTFGAPAFGSSGGNAASSTSAFGAPAFGNQANNSGSGSAFGAPSFGASNGTNTATGTGGGAFGKPAFANSAFGAGPTGANTSPFAGIQNTDSATAKPGPFGAANTSSGANPFGSLNKTTSPFGAISTGANNNTAFGQAAFGALNNNAAATQQSPFGQNNANATTTTTGSTNSAFGQSNFGKGPSPFSAGQNNDGSSPFGNLQNQYAPASANSAFTPQNSANSSAGGSGAFGSGAGQNNTSLPFGTVNTPKSSPFATSNQNDTNKNVSAPFETNQTPATASVFASGPKAANAAPSSSSGVFGNAAQNSGTNITPTANKDALKDISAEVLQKFQGTQFNLGDVPDYPPPMELIQQISLMGIKNQ
ncbi:FG-nucleoporin NUP42 KNAG_0A04680 [Huiozyma naganishii CBS 8797]|uniref:C3H1-type domain-containing protein n=1 Tax=Huiozyma naganishii (strain ATCC MYA-139 / BCRC 22969 / CBS 8797 / KCTC 17520 / NBRC 10181 / NCYC 3082 / Yp74L-3) TaxID=1071383 RepID=J7R017_HUIN7|nr:hypothetical protein KNAG_0A04680 [Kazachstania naganishii CBS 8797]CCK68140.1 hypothetical protein KNAG_0A04680 [Kazachstania naganishii CBS 8797]